MAKDYYAILGILPTATLEEIRSAYRSRVKQYHPDHFGKDSAPFLKVQEAYDVLSDPENRTLYDRTTGGSRVERIQAGRPEPLRARSSKQAVEPLRRARGPMDLGTITPLESFRTFHPSLDEIYDSLWNVFDLRSRPKSERFRTLTMEILLTRQQARLGGRVHIYVPVERPCPTCGGEGVADYFECWRCAGTGVSREELPIQVEYPPGIQDFYQIAIPLDRYGIHDVCPVLLFRISSTGDFEPLEF